MGWNQCNIHERKEGSKARRMKELDVQHSIEGNDY